VEVFGKSAAKARRLLVGLISSKNTSPSRRSRRCFDPDITASNVVSGATIFGTTGTTTVMTQCTSGVQATCESDTACRWNAGSCEINPWHIRAGITVASKAGSLKANCRNTINSTYYNWDGAIGSLTNAASTAGSLDLATADTKRVDVFI
jgi:hypothetical protein